MTRPAAILLLMALGACAAIPASVRAQACN